MIRWAVWSIYVGLLSLALLTPHPTAVAESLIESQEERFLVGKALHAAMFTGLALLSGWLGLRGRYRWLLAYFLSLYAFGTEFLQQFVPTRTGNLQDVAINHLGLMIGILLCWRCWLQD